jgi:hypothetical protein
MAGEMRVQDMTVEAAIVTGLDGLVDRHAG